MYCGSCGTELPDGARFCAKCGAAVNGGPAPAQRPAPMSAPAPAAMPNPVPQQVPAQPVTQAPAPSQPPADKNRRILLFALAGAACLLALVLGVYFGIQSSAQTTVAQVIIPLEVPDLDEDGTHVPVKVTGKDEEGSKVSETAFLAPDGSGLSLPLGTYKVKPLASPISAEGDVYQVPDTTIEITLDSEAVEEGKTTTVSESLVFVAIDAADVTDEIIDEALKWAKKDDSIDADRAEELADKARAARDDAIAKAEEERKADEGAPDNQGEAGNPGEPAPTDDDPDREANTTRIGNIVFVMPKPWRGATSVNTFDSGANVLYGDVGSVLSLQVMDTDPYWLANEPLVAFDLANGGTLAVYTQLDDGGVAGRFTDAEGRTCDLITTRFDGMENGGTNGEKSGIGREAQALVCGLDAASEPEQLAVECLHTCAENVSLT